MEPILRILNEPIASFRGDDQPNFAKPTSYDEDILCISVAATRESMGFKSTPYDACDQTRKL
jgi:hypothetical protein